jgi:DNA polymerase III sliding clamp (beta) subunit (PCNA family)
VLGQYGSYSASLSASRQVAPMTHGVFSFNLRKFDSGDFTNYNKWSYSVNLGLSFSPGDIPVRLW